MMSSEMVVVKQGFLKCPPFSKEVSFTERWPRCWCAVVAFNSYTGQGHYFLYVFNQQPRNINQLLDNLPSPVDASAATESARQPSILSDGCVLQTNPLPLRNCYYLRRCKRHSMHKNLFCVVFSHTSYYLASDTRCEMESWVMTFCEHLDVNFEEDQKPAGQRRTRIQQYSFGSLRSSSLKPRSSRPDSLQFPVPATPTSGMPTTTITALSNPATSAAYSSPSTGSMDSGSSLGIALNSDVSTSSSRATTQSAYQHQASSGTSCSGIAHTTDEDVQGSAAEMQRLGMKELTPSVCPATRPTVIPLASSQDSLYQADSGVSYDRESTPGSILHPENSDIVYNDPGFVVSRDDPFRRCDADDITPLQASPRSRSVSMNSASEYSPCPGLRSSGLAGAVSACNLSHFQSENDHESMPHRTPVILNGCIPTMSRKSHSVFNLAPSLSFSYGPVPPNSAGTSRLRRIGSLERDSYRRYSYMNRTTESHSGSARSSPALLTPSARSMVNVKLSIRAQRSHVLGHLLLVDAFNYVWVAGWNQRSPFLNRVFHVGDRVLSINSTPCSKASAATAEMQNSESEVEFVVVRTPLGNEVSITRHSTSEILGLVLRKNTITSILPNTPASFAGISLQAQGLSGKLVPWVMTEINTVPVDLFNADRDKLTEEMQSSGFFTTLLLQPKDFVRALKKKIRSAPNYKSFMQSSLRSDYTLSRGSHSTTKRAALLQTIHVQLVKSRPTIGITLKGGADTSDHTITIGSVDEHGIAHDDGFIKPGMEMIAVDGASLVGLAHQEAVQLIRQCFTSPRPFLELVVKAVDV